MNDKKRVHPLKAPGIGLVYNRENWLWFLEARRDFRSLEKPVSSAETLDAFKFELPKNEPDLGGKVEMLRL